MFFFSSSKEGNKNLNTDSVKTFVLPDFDDTAALKEVETQRLKWNNFLASHRNANIWEENWLWMNRTEHKADLGPVRKQLMLLFNSKVKTRKRMKSLVRHGVPPELRGRVWFACSGAPHKMQTAKPEETYGYLINRASTLEGGQIAADIDKDLMRTFPEYVGVDKDLSVEVLRRVLMAYALRNPTVGYCQSMNYLCALLLLHMKEEKAFWVFAALIEDILPPDYYSPSMLGGRIDQHVFQSCVAWKLPRLYAKFKETSTLLEPIICPWFLCLFINVLPLYTVCRVWDCLFWEGNAVIFRIGLSMLRSKVPLLLQANDFVSIYTILKSGGKIYSFELEPPPHSVGAHGGSGSGSGGGLAESSPYSPSGNNHRHFSVSLQPDDTVTMSATEYLIGSAFGYRWLRSVPVGKVELLREKFTSLFVNEEGEKKQSLLGAAGGAGRVSPKESKSPVVKGVSIKMEEEADRGAEGKDRSHKESSDPREAYLERVRKRSQRTRKSELMLKFLEEYDISVLQELAQQSKEESYSDHVEEFARQLHAEQGTSSLLSNTSSAEDDKEDFERSRDEGEEDEDEDDGLDGGDEEEEC